MKLRKEETEKITVHRAKVCRGKRLFEVIYDPSGGRAWF